MNRRQSIRVFLGALFIGATSKEAFAHHPLPATPPAESANPRLVKKLTDLLEQAKRGELTSCVGVAFQENGGIDRWGEIGRNEDALRVINQLEASKQDEIRLLAKTTAQDKG